MHNVKIEGVSPAFDGEYPLDLSYFTNRELHLIKQVSGVRAGELDEALGAGDNDVFVAVALIAAKRAGKDIPVDMLWDAPHGKVTLETDASEEDEADPPVPSPTQEPHENGDGNSELSGETSAEVLALHRTDQSRTGSLDSATGVVSA